MDRDKKLNMEDLSEETKLWLTLLKDIKDYYERVELVNKGKLIAKPPTERQLIKGLKSKYYLKEMFHGQRKEVGEAK